MRHSALFAIIAALLLILPCRSLAVQAYLFDITHLTPAQELTVSALQGLANRTGPRLYLYTGGIYWQHKFADNLKPEIASRFDCVDSFWVDWYSSRRSIAFGRVRSVQELLSVFRADYAGLCIYDAANDGARMAAITIAGLDRLLPVTPELADWDAWASPAETPGWRANLSDVDQFSQHSSYNVKLSTDGKALRAELRSDGYGLVRQRTKVDLSATPILRVGITDGRGWFVKARDPSVQRTDVLATGSGPGAACVDLAQKLALKGSAVVEVQVGLEGKAGESVAISQIDIGPEITNTVQPPLFPQPDTFRIEGRLDGDAWKDRLTAYRAAIRDLLPRCAPKDLSCLPSGVRTGSVDYGVQNRMFAFDLSYDPANREDYALVQSILGNRGDGTNVWGFGGGSEQVFISTLSRLGGYCTCTYVPNLSFHAMIPGPRQIKQRPRRAFEDVRTEDKYYVAFMRNEGDAVKTLTGLGEYGVWFQNGHGDVPINWGFSGIYLKYFPGIAAFYFETADPNDYFFGACGGAGYCLPGFLPEFSNYLKRGRPLVRNADLTIPDTWLWPPAPYDRSKLAKAFGAAAITEASGNRSYYDIIDGHIPLISGEICYSNRPLAEHIKAVAAAHGKPFFILAYTGSPEQFAATAKELDPREFKIVKLDELAGAAAHAGRLMLSAPKPGIAPSETLRLNVRVNSPLKNWHTKGRLVLSVSWPLKIEPEQIQVPDIPYGRSRDYELRLSAPGQQLERSYIITASLNGAVSKLSIRPADPTDPNEPDPTTSGSQ